jgi:hypothetical protein
MPETFQGLLPIHGKEFDAGTSGRWRARVGREPELPPTNTDELVCTVDFAPIGTGSEERRLKLRLSYFTLALSRYNPNDSGNYQQQIFTLCTDWLKLDQTLGEIKYFGIQK